MLTPGVPAPPRYVNRAKSQTDTVYTLNTAAMGTIDTVSGTFVNENYDTVKFFLQYVAAHMWNHMAVFTAIHRSFRKLILAGYVWIVQSLPHNARLGSHMGLNL